MAELTAPSSLVRSRSRQSVSQIFGNEHKSLKLTYATQRQLLPLTSSGVSTRASALAPRQTSSLRQLVLLTLVSRIDLWGNHLQYAKSIIRFQGTTLVLIASNAFSTYQKATGGVMDENTGLLRLTTAQFAKLESLFFDINGVSFHTSIQIKVQLCSSRNSPTGYIRAHGQCTGVASILER